MEEVNKQNRSLKNFIRSFRRGLGSAIIELKNNPDKDKYRAIVMRFCLRDIAYDTQVEGTKGFYLYTAVKTFVNSEIFLENIFRKFNDKLSWRLSEQLFDLICCFANDGCQSAEEALEKKYLELKKHLPLTHNFGDCEREQFERLMIRKLDGGFESFMQCINDMGEMIAKHGDDDCLCYGWFLYSAEEKFGEGIYSFLKNAKNNSVKTFFRIYEKSKLEKNGATRQKIININNFREKCKPAQDEDKEARITVEQLISRANELLFETAPNSFRARIAPMRQLSLKFAKQANEDELKTLAHIAVDESSDFIKIALLRVFSFANFPIDIGRLLPYATSDDTTLRDVTIDALSRIKDERVHALAIRLFDDAQIEDAIKLLEANFKIKDEALIRKHVMPLKLATYEIISSITEIYREHKSSSCGDILMHLYENAECAHCRYEVVETMINNEVMPKNILAECHYDSYEDTRILVNRS